MADELTSLCYGPNADLDRILSRFTALLPRTDVHLLCIGNPVPPQFLRHAAAFALDGFEEPQALAFLLANAPAFGLSQAQVSPLRQHDLPPERGQSPQNAAADAADCQR